MMLSTKTNRRAFLKCAASGLFVPSIMAIPPVFSRQRTYAGYPNPVYIFKQDFELAGLSTGLNKYWENGFNVSTSGTVDPNYVDNILYGSKSLLLNGDAAIAQFWSNTEWTINYSEVYAHFLYMPLSIYDVTSKSIFATLTSGGGNAGFIQINTDGTVRGVHYSAGTAYTTNSVVVGTLYHFWMHYKSASVNPGGDGIMEVEFNTTGIYTGSGGGFSSLKTGTSTNKVVAVNALQYWTSGHTSSGVFDRFRIAETPNGIYYNIR